MFNGKITMFFAEKGLLNGLKIGKELGSIITKQNNIKFILIVIIFILVILSIKKSYYKIKFWNKKGE